MYDISREEQNHRSNHWLLENYERMKAQEQQEKEPIQKTGKKTTCKTAIEQAKALYDAGKTHREIGLLLGMSISSAGRMIRMNKKNSGKRRH